MTQTTLNSISRLQHKAIRVMTNSTYNANTEPLFYANNVLPLRKLILQSKLLFKHSIEYNYAPASFPDIFNKKMQGRLIIILEIVRDGHGGGGSRKINAWHMYTLMVYL